jgi:hypothetical protein
MNFSYGTLILLHNDNVVPMLQQLWKQPGIQSVYQQRTDSKIIHFQSLQCLGYFMTNIERITSIDQPYIPSDEDIQFCTQYLNEDRSGIETVEWTFSGQSYVIFNVKGKYNDCRKWLFQFEGVNVVCFLCPLGDYDITPDKGRENVLKESLNLFDRMCNSEWFRNTPVMLLMTNFDEFREKINDTDLICCFHDYNGGCVYQSAVQFCTQKFLNVRKKKKFEFSSLVNVDEQSHIVEEDPSSGIYPIYTSRDDSVEELVNNIGGTLKNIMYMQRVEAQKKRRSESSQKTEKRLSNGNRSGSFRRGSMTNSSSSSSSTSSISTSSDKKPRSGSFFSKLSNIAKKNVSAAK